MVSTLLPIGKSGEPTILAECVEKLMAPRKKLVDIALVAHIPDNLVSGAMKNPVESDGQFHHS
jgi:hypothetical protein